LFDIRTLDHFIIGTDKPYSFAEHGLIWLGDSLPLFIGVISV